MRSQVLQFSPLFNKFHRSCVHLIDFEYLLLIQKMIYSVNKMQDFSTEHKHCKWSKFNFSPITKNLVVSNGFHSNTYNEVEVLEIRYIA